MADKMVAGVSLSPFLNKGGGRVVEAQCNVCPYQTPPLNLPTYVVQHTTCTCSICQIICVPLFQTMQ